MLREKLGCVTKLASDLSDQDPETRARLIGMASVGLFLRTLGRQTLLHFVLECHDGIMPEAAWDWSGAACREALRCAGGCTRWFSPSAAQQVPEKRPSEDHATAIGVTHLARGGQDDVDQRPDAEAPERHELQGSCADAT